MKEIRVICKKFAFSKGETKRVLCYASIINDNLEKKLMSRLSASQIYKLLEPLSYEVIMLIKAKSKNRRLRRNIKDFFNKYNGMRIYISGDDLVKIGIPAGPDYNKLLTRVLYARLDKKINTKQEEIDFVKKVGNR